jgi:hypothetical protein
VVGEYERAFYGDHSSIWRRRAPDLNGPRAVADYLRANGLSATCTAKTCTIDAPAGHAAERATIFTEDSPSLAA